MKSGKVRVPVIPGLRWLYNKAMTNLVAPHLKDDRGDKLLATDMAAESFTGASNYATALSNGRLFIEVSPWAELTVFRWPNPTYSDHLRYFTFSNGVTLGKGKPVRMGDEAPCRDWKRYGRPVEPCPGLGSAGGVRLNSGQAVWTSDPVWTSSRNFFPQDSTILITRLESAKALMEVKDFIHPRYDMMVRSFKIEGQVGKFFYHSTFAPFLAGPGQYVKEDPSRAGFAALYLSGHDALVHFQPRKKNEPQFKAILREGITASDLDRAYPEGGVFVAWAFIEGSDGYQVGADLCRRRGQVKGPLSGKDDASDGELSQNQVHIGLVDAALSRSLDSGSHSIVTVVISVSDSASSAVELIERARVEGAHTLESETIEHWKATSQRIYLPQKADTVTARVARRSVLNLIQGQDKEGGCIVASVSRQPPYHFDWPRDGAFFDLALDLAGFPELVTRHHKFYQRTQYRRNKALSPIRLVNFQLPFYKPAGHWPANMAADGSLGSIPYTFEIDETALMAWNIWRHERELPADQREQYIAEMKITLELCTDALLDYVDLDKGWTRPAVEDDNFPPDATLHGVSSVLTGLTAACDAGSRWGIDLEKTRRWGEATVILGQGLRARITDPEIREQAGLRGLAWSLWPAPVFENYDEPGARAIKEEIAKRIQEKVNKQTPGFAYLGEELFILALADSERGEYKGLLEKGLRFLTSEVPFPGTDCYGEVTVWVDVGGENLAQQRTSIPHIWNGISVYIAAIAFCEPERFELMRPPVP